LFRTGVAYPMYNNAFAGRNNTHANFQIIALQHENRNLQHQMNELRNMLLKMQHDITTKEHEQRVINIEKREYDCMQYSMQSIPVTFDTIFDENFSGCGIYSRKLTLDQRESLCRDRENSLKMNFLIDNKLNLETYTGPLPPGCGRPLQLLK
jgi:hypothetical protein